MAATPSRPQAKPHPTHLQRQQHCDDMRVRCAPDSTACSCTAVAPWAAVACEPALRAPWRDSVLGRDNFGRIRCHVSITSKSSRKCMDSVAALKEALQQVRGRGLRMRRCWYLDRSDSDVRLTPVWAGCCSTAADFRCPGN